MLPRAKEIVDAADLKMKDSVEFLEEDLKTYRVGKANPSIFNNVTVDYYGTPTPINQMGNISVPEPRMLIIALWDTKMIPAVEKAIQRSVRAAESLHGRIALGDLPFGAMAEEQKG